MPTPKKSVEQRQRSNHPKALDAQVVAINNEAIPFPLTDLCDELMEEWREVWASEVAAVWDRKSELPAIRRLFALRERERRFDLEGMAEPLVPGSTGQLTINPLLKFAKEVRAEILALEDRFGLNSKARLGLGISLGAAHASLDDMNNRIKKNAAGGASERPDPRITSIETTAS